MKDSIAMYFGNTVIYWSSIMIIAGLMAGIVLALAFYVPKHKYVYSFFIYCPLAILLSVFFSRLLHWYCNVEQYESLEKALSDYYSGGFLMPGVLIGTYLAALVLQLFRVIKSRYDILDSAAPGLSFIIGIISFSDIYSGLCRGKMMVVNPVFQELPFAVADMDAQGQIQYRFAVFFIRFILMMVITCILTFMLIREKRSAYHEKISNKGHGFRWFLALYGMTEIVMDSMRNDAAHLYFPGEALASLNKGASFMGVSQILGALCCVYVCVYYLISMRRAYGHTLKSVLLGLLFLSGIIIGGVSEYLVQRYSGMYKVYYTSQICGVFMMGAGLYVLYRMGISNYNISKNISEDNNGGK